MIERLLNTLSKVYQKKWNLKDSTSLLKQTRHFYNYLVCYFHICNYRLISINSLINPNKYSNSFGFEIELITSINSCFVSSIHLAPPNTHNKLCVRNSLIEIIEQTFAFCKFFFYSRHPILYFFLILPLYFIFCCSIYGK